MGPDLEQALTMVRETVRGGGTLFFCGNGGSAADAQHMATEYVVRYMRERRAYPAVALTTDTSLLTAAGNDLGFESDLRAAGRRAGAKPATCWSSIRRAATRPTCCARRRRRARRACACWRSARAMAASFAALADHSVVIPTPRTDRAQELHLCIEHLICELVERAAMIGLEGKARAGHRRFARHRRARRRDCSRENGVHVAIGYRSRARRTPTHWSRRSASASA